MLCLVLRPHNGILQRRFQVHSISHLAAWDVKIPRDQLSVHFCRSSGPGGQNVNKRSTKVEIRFHILNATWIPQKIRETLHVRTQSQQNTKGELVLTCSQHRTQEHNYSACEKKLKQLLVDARDVTAGGMTKLEKKVEKIRRNKSRNRRRHRDKALDSSSPVTRHTAEQDTQTPSPAFSHTTQPSPLPSTLVHSTNVCRE